jgi:hypothetical protein
MVISETFSPGELDKRDAELIEASGGEVWADREDFVRRRLTKNVARL